MMSVQNGYAPIATNDAIMLTMTMTMPTQRPTELRLEDEPAGEHLHDADDQDGPAPGLQVAERPDVGAPVKYSCATADDAVEDVGHDEEDPAKLL